METKTLIELYKEVLQIFKGGHSHFLCNAINIVNSSEENKKVLKEHFFSQMPSKTQYTEIYNEPTFNKKVINNDTTDIWFVHVSQLEYKISSKINYQLRIKLIEAIINKLENNCI